MLIDLTFQGEKATYELASGLAKFGAEVVGALKDGFQPLQDLAVIGAAAVTDLLPVATDVSKLGPELSENKVAFLNSWLKAGEELYEKLVQK